MIAPRFATVSRTSELTWVTSSGPLLKNGMISSSVRFCSLICTLSLFFANKLTESSQARSPSSHVNRRFELSGSPHMPNQAPPMPQQLRSPCFMPHLEHWGMVVSPSSVPFAAVVSASAFLQARTPSLHECGKFALSGSPQRPNQEPPIPQQVGLPPGLVPHLAHVGIVAGVSVVAAETNIWAWVSTQEHPNLQIGHELT